jgi:hypothetical protein
MPEARIGASEAPPGGRQMITRADFGTLLESRGRPILDCEVAEVGVAEGRFSLDIVRWGVKRLYLVDAWRCMPHQRGDAAEPQAWHDANLQACMDRLAEHWANVVFLRGLSVDMAQKVPDGSLDLVHLDGDHSYEGVAGDLVAWLPKLRAGGIMSGHDYLNTDYGVMRAVREVMGEHPIHLAGEGENASFYFYAEEP